MFGYISTLCPFFTFFNSFAYLISHSELFTVSTAIAFSNGIFLSVNTSSQRPLWRHNDVDYMTEQANFIFCKRLRKRQKQNNTCSIYTRITAGSFNDTHSADAKPSNRTIAWAYSDTSPIQCTPLSINTIEPVSPLQGESCLHVVFLMSTPTHKKGSLAFCETSLPTCSDLLLRLQQER